MVWKVEGISQEQAEDLQKAMAREFGADQAATDCTRVLRLPGFANKKYYWDFHIEVRQEAIRTYHAKDFVISVEPRENFYPTPEPPSTQPHNETPQISQSERDWSYAMRALSRGEDPEEVTRRIADYRADEKPNPDLCRVNEYADKVNQNSEESGSPDDRTRHKR